MPTNEQVREIEREVTAQFQQLDLAATITRKQSELPPLSEVPGMRRDGISATGDQAKARRVRKKRTRNAAARTDAGGSAPEMMDFLKRAYSNPHIRAAMSDLAEK